MVRQPPLSKSPKNRSVSSILESLHEFFSDGKKVTLDLSSLTSLSASKAVPDGFIRKVWQHAYRQSEDELVMIFPTHNAANSLMLEALGDFPGVDNRMLTALVVLEPFLTAMTPQNLNQKFHNGVSANLSLNSQGEVVSMRLKLSAQSLLSIDPLTKLPSQEGYRAFDVFYHMLYSQLEDSSRVRMLSLKPTANDYELLRKSGTTFLPDWVKFADDYALAKDWSDAVAEVFPRSFQRSLMMILSGILLMGNQSNPSDVAEGAALIGLDFKSAKKHKPLELIKATYVSLIESVETMLNRYLASLDLQSQANDLDSIYSVVTLVELTPNDLHKYHVLRAQFDNNYAMNSEMINDGINIPKAPSNIIKDLTKLERQGNLSPTTYITNLGELLDPTVEWFQQDTTVDFLDVERLIMASRVWTLLSLAPADKAKLVADRKTWSTSVVSSQIRDLYVTEWIARAKLVDYTADYDTSDFLTSFAPLLPPGLGMADLANWAESLYRAPDFFQGHERVYLSEAVWSEFESRMRGDMSPPLGAHSIGGYSGEGYEKSVVSQLPPPAMANQVPAQVQAALQNVKPEFEEGSFLNGDNDDEPLEMNDEDGQLLHDFKGLEEGRHIEIHTQTRGRKAWVIFVWLLTWWVPSPLLNWFGGMKRRDVRLAWREKLTIFFLIFLLNCGVVFYMIILGRLICPDYAKVWNHKELAYHQGTNDFYVGIHGKVYDISKFYTQQHSDNGIKTSAATMLPMAGLDLSDYFPPPLSVACPSLVGTNDANFTLMYNMTRSPYTEALHTSGPELQPKNDTALHEITWYHKVFQPAIKQYYKGRIVQTPKEISKMVDADPSRYIVIMNKTIYDMSNYMQTINQYPAADSPTFQKYNFFPTSVSNLFMNYQGMDITEKFHALDEKTRANALECMNNMFVYAELDFRHSAKCQAANVILLVMAGVLTSITVIKFLASLRFGSAPMPAPQDRFVICQVPIYTEGEDDMRLAIDSLTNLKYDNRRKLLVLLCDGMITGAGNDRPTPQIVLDVLGVDDSRIDPEPKAYHAIAEGSRELNYAKVYSGLYDHDGDMVPYICIVKCGAPNESRPGNRGKRDSQLIIMNFLNRVHYGDPMCPLDLEIFHHMNNIIGVEPERFEYIFTIDADTSVFPDSLTRLVAACQADNSISAVCGETGIENEKQGLSTMIQVYEYFISHHLTKAFESLFGTVTCLPGCFSLYRLKTVQRGKPLLISSEVIREYSLRHVDTLHKKNLFSLGEDRYLTTLMSKHFPRMKTKFVADAKCLTQVPDQFSVLLSQRRRWINSTVHNLSELLYLETMCGFCMFSMRGVVFTDLVGTMMLPSVVIYLGYLIYVLASNSQPLPIISIVLICSVYGLQSLVFIMHRRWQHIFWMLVYIAAYPFHSFILPIYSFWYMDDFSWGNTRVVVDESKGRKVVVQDDQDIYDPKSVPFEPWSTYATRKGLPGRERAIIFDPRKGRIERDVFEDPARFEPYEDGTSPYDSRSTLVGPPGTRPQSVYSLGQAKRGMESGALPFDAGTAAQIRDTIQQVLNSTDLDTMTPQQLRAKVGDLLGTEFTGERAAAVDAMIDLELERLDDEAYSDDIGHTESPSEGFVEEIGEFSNLDTDHDEPYKS